MENSANLNLPFIMPQQAQKHVTHNEAIRALDAIVHLSVNDRTRTTPPIASTEGARYIVASNATDSWSGQDARIAAFQDGGWAFYPPQTGWLAWIEEEEQLSVFDGMSWIDVSTSSNDSQSDGASIETLSINGAFADTVNRIAVNASATLLNHDGTDHRLVINKADMENVGSLLFQSGFSGRAEMGIVGNDNFTIRVTENGSNWQTSLSIDPTIGTVNVSSLTMAGAIGVDNYFGRASFHPAGRPNNLNSADFLMSGGINNNFVFASNANNNNEGLVFGHLKNNTFTEQMRLDAISQRLGIGTKTPTTKLHVEGPVRIGSYTVATAPNASTTGAGSIIYIEDDTGGAIPAFSDGQHWRRMSDRNIITS